MPSLEQDFYKHPDLTLLQPNEGTEIPIELCAYPRCIKPIKYRLVSKLANRSCWLCESHAQEAHDELTITKGARQAWWRAQQKRMRKHEEWLKRQKR